MNTQRSKVYQFKITLEEITPTIWRQIQVPANYSFWDLHVAIQDSMGWLDYHLHEFEIANPETKALVRIGIPFDDDDWSRATLPGWEVDISDYFTLESRIAKYTYDFGDAWKHLIELESITVLKSQQRHPICVAGERACPPEDVGGAWGYETFLEVIKNSDHEEHEDMLEWIGGKYDPQIFKPSKVRFDDPGKRWKFAFDDRGVG